MMTAPDSSVAPSPFSVTGGMCPRCESMDNVTDVDLSQL